MQAKEALVEHANHLPIGEEPHRHNRLYITTSSWWGNGLRTRNFIKSS